MDAQLKRGILDACVLSIVNREETYGYKLVVDAKDIIELSESTLYPILRRLEQSGYLETFTKEFQGRLRKYYKITPTGLKKLVEYKIDWLEMQRIYKAIFE